MTRWGVHPVLESALDELGEAAFPADLERALPAPRRLSTRDLTEVAQLCAAHAALKATRATRAEVERLTKLVARHLATPVPHPREPWRADLAHARTITEHSRAGALRIAALAAEVAWCDVMRAGVDASVLAADAARETVRLLKKDRGALHAFLSALMERMR